MIVIRQMHLQDAGAIRHVDSVAFGAWARQTYGKQSPSYRRTLANVRSCLEKDPEGCFVAEEEEQIVGFIFSRTWGGVGWFGTFAVLPEYQGRGLGKRLIAASLDYLQREPERVIGLETMFDSPYNLGLYLKLGFQASFPTFLLTKALEGSVTDEIGLPRWSTSSRDTRERWLADLQQATGKLQAGLDYSKEILSMTRYRLGETLVLVNGQRAVGLSVVWLTSGWEGMGAERASVQALALHPAYTNTECLGALLGATEALSRTQGKDTVTVAVNGRHAWALQRLLESGYHVSRAMVRMLWKAGDVGPTPDRWVDCSRWAG